MSKGILHIVSGGGSGGAALGVRALHRGLLDQGFNSIIVFDDLEGINEEGCIELDTLGKFKLFCNKILEKIILVFNRHDPRCLYRSCRF